MNCCKNSLSCSAKSVLGSQSLPPESRWLLYTFQHARKHCSQLDRRCEGALEGKCRTPRLPQLRAPRPARWLPAGLELSQFGQAGPAGSVPSRALSLRGASALATRTKSSVPAAVPARERPVPALPVHRDPRPSALPRGRAGQGPARITGPARTGTAPGGSAAANAPRSRDPQRPASPPRRRRASPARPAGGRLSAQGRPPGARAIVSPPSPALLPGSPEATTARQRGSPALTEVRRDALPPPAACSPRPAARAIVAFLEKLGRGKERGEGRGWEGTEIEGERSMQRQEVETATTSAGD